MSDATKALTPATTVWPLISQPWQRAAIMEVIDHWKGNSAYNGTRRNAAIATRRLLWMLPESRNGIPVRNPINGRQVRRPKDAKGFRDVIRGCLFWDGEVGAIVARHEFKNDCLKQPSREDA